MKRQSPLEQSACCNPPGLHDGVYLALESPVVGAAESSQLLILCVGDRLYRSGSLPQITRMKNSTSAVIYAYSIVWQRSRILEDFGLLHQKGSEMR